jgi:uncharacterized membrane protein HdeD (DUF308 family)
MKKVVNDTLNDFALISVVFIVLGVLFLVFPDTSGKMVCYLLAALLCLLGLIRVVSYFSIRPETGEYRPDLTIGILLLAGGVFVFAKPGVILSVLPIAIGIAVLIDSVVKLQHTIDMLRMGSSGWMITLVITIVTTILGIVMLINPFATAKVFLRFVGIALIITGALDIWSFGSLKVQMRKLRRAYEDSQAVETTFEDVTDR